MGAYTKEAGPAFDAYLMGFRPGDGFARCGPETGGEFECSEVAADCTIPTSGCNGLLSCVQKVYPVQCISEVDACSDPCKSCGDSGVGGLTSAEVEAIASTVVANEAPAIASQCATDAIVAAAAQKA